MDYKKPQGALVHGGAGIYPLTTADQVILSDGSRLEKDGKISADSAADSAKLGGKAPEYYLSPRNLLDNSDFRNPVNQRGISSGATVSAWKYFIDRWRAMTSDITVTLDGNGMTIPSGGITQYIPSIQVGKAYTIAACFADGTVLCASATATKNEGWTRLCYDKTDGVGRIDFVNSDSGNLYELSITLYGTAIVWAALYEGAYTADTLPPYVPKGYAQELAECKRYYKHLGGGWYYMMLVQGMGVAIFVPSEIQMRVNPSVITDGLQVFDGDNGWRDATINYIEYVCGTYKIMLASPTDFSSGTYLIKGLSALSSNL